MYKRPGPGRLAGPIVLGAAFMMMAAGCAPVFHSPVPANDPSVAALAKAAEGIHRDLSRLASVEQSRTGLPQKVKAAPPAFDPSVKKPITLDWSGPIEPVLKIIAGEIGYRFKAVGEPGAQAGDDSC